MTATTTPGSNSAVPETRWTRRPDIGIRLLAGPAPPLAIATTFLVAWSVVASWPDAPQGDTNFAWMPAGVIVVCVGAALAGLAALAARTGAQVLGLAVFFWLAPAALLFPAAFVGDGFPTSAAGLMIGCAALSLVPTAMVAVWVALPDHPVRPVDRPATTRPGQDRAMPPQSRRPESPHRPREDADHGRE